ncbi:uncharacterized protein JN550_004818 [Neoarthrinium moseri]|uniref:uncharacterized protein n=1 Tax=Neoarthrinium moseri TaxID=1658444 RepID=UPI001FDCA72A|nr:uncharacterized protein JN550_004818 [Neoarthrinium moseri]KAI1870672.1 hypothetical protein JN550_004818 [Neoarthrinium moseri]
MADYFDGEDADLMSSSSSNHSSSDGDGGGGDSNDSSAHRAPQPPPPSQNFFAPPFYGRPPTPLPPSPSLTSLLRPSRPTTPDASDDENQANGALEPAVARASPRVPTYEYYGFVLYLFSTLAFGMYLLWAYLPSAFLHAMGIYYYPNRWWALAVPAFLVMLIVYIYVALAAYNTEYLTLGLGNLETVVDDAAKVAAVGDGERGHDKGARARAGAAPWGSGRVFGPGEETDWRRVWDRGTDAVMDIPLAGVNEVLYGYADGDDEDGDAS